MNVELAIDRLDLDGVDLTPLQRKELQSVVQRELSRLLGSDAQSQTFRGGGTLASLTLPSIQHAEHASPVQLGRQISHAVYGGLVHD